MRTSSRTFRRFARCFSFGISKYSGSRKNWDIEGVFLFRAAYRAENQRSLKSFPQQVADLAIKKTGIWTMFQQDENVCKRTNLTS